MIDKRHALLAGALLLSTSLSAAAQGTYSNGVRSGYSGTTSGPPASTTTSTAPSTSPTQSSRNWGTGQGRTEGAMGLSPQMQRETGIGRQQ